MCLVGFKFNTFQQHLQDSKQKKDYNINPLELEIEDIEYNEENVQYADMAAKFIFDKVKEVFDPVTVGIWRLRYMVTIDNQELNYKKIKQLTRCRRYQKKNSNGKQVGERKYNTKRY